MFFMSDAYGAAFDAAYALRDHGLSDPEMEDLAQKITDAMAEFFTDKKARHAA